MPRIHMLIALGGVTLAAVLAGCGSSASGSPKPAARVNGHPISMAAYNTQVMYLRKRTQTSSTQIDPCAPSTSSVYQSLCHSLKQSALSTLIADELIQEYARQHHITVSKIEFDQAWNALIKNQFHQQLPVLQATVKGLGITVADYREMERRYLLETKVLYAVTRNLPERAASSLLSRIDAASLAEVRAVQQRLKSGEPFNRIAAQLDRDKKSMCAQRACGTLGWYPDALLSSAQASIATTPAGHVAGPFAGQAGYSLILVIRHDAHHLLTPRQQLGLREQAFGKWLAARQKKASVRRYVAT